MLLFYFSATPPLTNKQIKAKVQWTTQVPKTILFHWIDTSASNSWTPYAIIETTSLSSPSAPKSYSSSPSSWPSSCSFAPWFTFQKVTLVTVTPLVMHCGPVYVLSHYYGLGHDEWWGCDGETYFSLLSWVFYCLSLCFFVNIISVKYKSNQDKLKINYQKFWLFQTASARIDSVTAFPSCTPLRYFPLILPLISGRAVDDCHPHNQKYILSAHQIIQWTPRPMKPLLTFLSRLVVSWYLYWSYFFCPTHLGTVFELCDQYMIW